MQLQPSSSKTTAPDFKNNATAPNIMITRGDLNKALFIGKHYAVDLISNRQVFISDSVDVIVSAPAPMLHRPRNQPVRDHVIFCQLKDVSKNKRIDLVFTQQGQCLHYKRGNSVDNHNIITPIKDGNDLCAALGEIYKAVRSEVDQKWSVNYHMQLEGREAAGQPLDTGLLPNITYTGSQIIYSAPAIGVDKVCVKNCAKCPLKL